VPGSISAIGAAEVKRRSSRVSASMRAITRGSATPLVSRRPAAGRRGPRSPADRATCPSTRMNSPTRHEQKMLPPGMLTFARGRSMRWPVHVEGAELVDDADQPPPPRLLDELAQQRRLAAAQKPGNEQKGKHGNKEAMSYEL